MKSINGSVRGIALALFVAVANRGQGDEIWSETFESDGQGTRYTSAQYIGALDDYFGRFQTSEIKIDSGYTGGEGTYWFGGQDQDGTGEAAEQTVTFMPIAVDGIDSLVFKALFAESRPAADALDDIDAADHIHVQYRLDGGTWTDLLWFENDGTTYNTTFRVDSEFDGVGEGTQLETAFAEFSAAIAGTGSSLELRITASVDAADEDWAVDNLRVEGDVSGPPLPEPTNYPTAFMATGGVASVALTWVDSVGGQLPSRYLIVAQTLRPIMAPTDRVAIANDTDLSDGAGALNVAYGVQQATFGDLKSGVPYFFCIYPYCNSGTNTDYKTDGEAPTTYAVTLVGPVVFADEDFEGGDFGDWLAFSVGSDKDWTVYGGSGADGSANYAAVNGYGQTETSDDWLISPPLTLTGVKSAVLHFWTQFKYGTDDGTADYLKLLYSTDYPGGGTPVGSTWNELAFVKPEAEDIWTSSGDVNLDAFLGRTIYVAFQYYSETSPRRWYLDEIVVEGEGAGPGKPGTIIIVR